MSDLQGTIEGMLFAWGDPLEVKEIAEVLQVTRQDVELASWTWSSPLSSWGRSEPLHKARRL